MRFSDNISYTSDQFNRETVPVPADDFPQYAEECQVIKAAHGIFYLPEVLEMILLGTNLRTLLSSAQRVCRTWHSVILYSPRLQEALFFRPLDRLRAREGPPARNSLLTEILWPEIICKRVHFSKNPPSSWIFHYPEVWSERPDVYTRPEASWRRMLLQQPPQFYVGVAQMTSMLASSQALSFTRLEVQRTESPVRMQHIMEGMDAQILSPYPEAWTFCVHPLNPHQTDCFLQVYDWVIPGYSKPSLLLSSCSIMVFTLYDDFFETDITGQVGIKNKFRIWVEGIGQTSISQVYQLQNET